LFRPLRTQKTFLRNMSIISGEKISATIKQEIKQQVDELVQKHGKAPGLAVILVGERKDSQTYVRMKKKAAALVGIKSFEATLPENISQDELIETIRKFNQNPDVHGILVQLPLPKHIDEERVLSEVSLEKDVDGFHPINIGKLCMKGRKPLFVPCTPRGVIELLDRSGIPIEGKNAVVIGRSNIVGIPVAMLLLHRNATVTICHTRTKDIVSKVKDADIVVACCGVAHYVKKDWIKEGAVVIDVGVNAVEDKTRKTGYRLVGDVDFENVKQVASAITPVPGGVGPMTIAMLLRNTLDSANRAFQE
jgi:5,10-methylene-tetrahydrofolate dehydrogenase/methenyl tetrahydrofolate cyclohydrolase